MNSPYPQPQTIGLVAFTGKPESAQLAEQVKNYLINKGVGVIDSAKGLGQTDAIVVLAGDGTVMHTAAKFAKEQIPVLGVSPVRVGFLSAVDNNNIYPALDHLLTGNYLVEGRMMLSAEYVRKDGQPQQLEALNDIMVKGLLKLIDLEGGFLKILNDRPHLDVRGKR